MTRFVHPLNNCEASTDFGDCILAFFFWPVYLPYKGFGSHTAAAIALCGWLIGQIHELGVIFALYPLVGLIAAVTINQLIIDRFRFAGWLIIDPHVTYSVTRLKHVTLPEFESMPHDATNSPADVPAPIIYKKCYRCSHPVTESTIVCKCGADARKAIA